MDAFEDIVAGIYRQRLGYWTWQSYKINLTKEDKREIGTHSMPRSEIDILAYKPVENTLMWIECKSYLDSKGVIVDAFNGKNPAAAKRYKIFANPIYRRIVSERLIQQVSVDEKLTLPDPFLRYSLVAGRIYEKDRTSLEEHFKHQGWDLHDRSWITSQLTELAKNSYENDVATMVAKLFQRPKGK